MYQPATQVIRFNRVAVMQPFVAYFESIGVPTEKYLSQVGLTPAMLDDPYSPIPTSLAFEFINATCQAESIDDIGLLAGQAASVRMMGKFGKRLLESKTNEPINLYSEFFFTYICCDGRVCNTSCNGIITPLIVGIVRENTRSFNNLIGSFLGSSSIELFFLFSYNNSDMII